MNCPRSKTSPGLHDLFFTRKLRTRLIGGERRAQGCVRCSCGHVWWSACAEAVRPEKPKSSGSFRMFHATITTTQNGQRMTTVLQDINQKLVNGVWMDVKAKQ